LQERCAWQGLLELLQPLDLQSLQEPLALTAAAVLLAE
jgi:hypothetical protein